MVLTTSGLDLDAHGARPCSARTSRPSGAEVAPGPGVAGPGCAPLPATAGVPAVGVPARATSGTGERSGRLSRGAAGGSASTVSAGEPEGVQRVVRRAEQRVARPPEQPSLGD